MQRPKKSAAFPEVLIVIIISDSSLKIYSTVLSNLLVLFISIPGIRSQSSSVTEDARPRPYYRPPASLHRKSANFSLVH
jgi:hypothetical protein